MFTTVWRKPERNSLEREQTEALRINCVFDSPNLPIIILQEDGKRQVRVWKCLSGKVEHLDIELRLLLGGAGQLFRYQGGLQDALSFLHRREQKASLFSVSVTGIVARTARQKKN